MASADVERQREPVKRKRFDPKQRLARCNRQIAGFLRKIDLMRAKIDNQAEERMRLLLSMRVK